MNKRPSALMFAAGSVFVAAVWITFASINLGRPVEKWGVFGDKFGALNCLFTGLALVAVIASHLYEREQATQRDTDQTRLLKAMESQATAMHRSYLFHAKTHRLERLQSAMVRLQGMGNSEAVQKYHAHAAEVTKLQEQLDRMSEDKFSL